MAEAMQTLPRLVGTWFQVLFHSPPGVLFTIPSWYYPLSVIREYLGLAGGPAGFTQDFSGPVLLGIPLESRRLTSTGVSPSMPRLSSTTSTSSTISYSLSTRQRRLSGPTTPGMQRLPAITHDRFSLFRVRSPLLAESLLFSLPVGTEMFHFPTFPPTALCVQAAVTTVSCRWVSPFGNPRINAWLAAPRGLSQPPTSFFGS